MSICSQKGKKTAALNNAQGRIFDENEFIGINTRKDLLDAQKYMQRTIVQHWMTEGVTFLNDDTVIIHHQAQIGKDTVIYPNVIIEGETKIGASCTIRSNTRITASNIEEGATIKDNTVIESSSVLAKTSIGPFAHLRPGSIIGPNAKIGNFVEIKNSTIGDNSKASHLSYIGDAHLGSNINIGAGTITCNYDGKNKHRTTIKDGVFIGSDTQIIAPVTIHENSFVAAGSTITEDVPQDSLALSRVKQKNIVNGASKIINRKAKK
ncbi:bifunctional N-acetylglucosamine-1-phosphate uridyltransferase / glucosamine-1-phosphate N-acetyltransferase [Candidatus Magnetoovum chiemensis]|nr:bifunctional N-acetylglucosamine-1-phosphate uridyltransferase / glucosamine-1-phosphate N-acetyltransferase [Candidatus Magnetoovum chiemensis]